MKNSERYCGCSRSPRNEEYKEYNEEYRRILDEMIRKMTEAQLTGNVSLNFIRQMIPHHRAAVQMSENLLKYRGSGPLAKNCGKYNHGTDKGYFRNWKKRKENVGIPCHRTAFFTVTAKKTTLYYVICFRK